MPRISLIAMMVGAPLVAAAYATPSFAQTAAPQDPAEPAAPAEPVAPAEPAEPAAQPMATGKPRPSMTLPAGTIRVDVALELNMSEDAVAKPLSIAPDVSYGVTNNLTVALTHSRFAATGFRAGSGGGLCLTGTDNGCVSVYNNVGVEGWHNVPVGKLALALGGGVHAVNLDAGYYSVKVGFKARHTINKLSITTVPSVFIGVTEREDEGGNKLNKDALWAPVLVTYKVATPVTVGLGFGIKGLLSEFADSWQLSTGAMVQYAVDKKLSLGGSWTFGQLVGGAEDPPAPAPALTGTAYRGVQLWAGYSL